MNTHSDKTQKTKIQSVPNAISQKQRCGESTFQFVDNRSEAVAQRKLQEMANSSPRVKQLKAFKELLHTNSQTTPLQPVIQRQCDHCDNVACDDGSICNYNGRAYGIGQHGARRCMCSLIR